VACIVTAQAGSQPHLEQLCVVFRLEDFLRHAGKAGLDNEVPDGAHRAGVIDDHWRRRSGGRRQAPQGDMTTLEDMFIAMQQYESIGLDARAQEVRSWLAPP
jgi:hypothetical protein